LIHKTDRVFLVNGKTMKRSLRSAGFAAGLLLGYGLVLSVVPRAAVAQVPIDPAAVQAKERVLIEVLKSGAPPAKAMACKQLAVFGSAAAVPHLAPLLADERLASWARIALEVIPGPEADAALRTASQSLTGRLLIGTIHSIGVRRDGKAVEILSGRLKDADEEVASAAALALGRIGSDQSTSVLKQSLSSAQDLVQSSVAEGCVLCAERLLADGKGDESARLYDEVRQTRGLPKQRVLEATRGAILARKTGGIPLLVEQLRSTDEALFRLGLTVARELPGREVARAIADEVAVASPDRASLVLRALGDRTDAFVSPEILRAASSGPKPVRLAALALVGRWGDTASVPVLLAAAIEDDAKLAETARVALTQLKGEKIDAEIAARLDKAQGKQLKILVELVGQRRISATPALLATLEHSDGSVRQAALASLGATVGAEGLPVLIAHVVQPKHPEDAEAAQKALKAASVRMPQREACAAQLAAALPKSNTATQGVLLETLASVGGAKALATVAAAANGNQPELQDTASRLLGEWMTADAAPDLLALAKSAKEEKYRVRALRGYLRIVRQFVLPIEQRAKMCAEALEVAHREAEQELTWTALERFASPQMLKVVVQAGKNPKYQDRSRRAAAAIARKLDAKSPEVAELLSQAGIEPVTVEILKAEYGAGDKQRDVTDILRKQVRNLPFVSLPGANYNASFGGDPAPNQVKRLKIQYRINGRSGEATFRENAAIELPIPK
jgi:HEAT repeat protein